MNELADLAKQEKKAKLQEKIPKLGRLQSETKRLRELVKRGNYNDSDIVDVHSLIQLAKEQVEQLKGSEGIEALEETIPEIRKLQDETKRLMKLVKKVRSQDSNMLDIHSLITLAKEKVKHLTNYEENPKNK